MSEVKREIIAVIKNELLPLARGREGDNIKVVVYGNDIIKNDNFIQELENVVHSFSKPKMQAEDTIARLERQLANEKSAKDDLLRMYNKEQDRNKLLHERNKRLRDENKKLDKGIRRVENRENRCDHIELIKEPEGIAFESTVQLKQVEVGLYKLACTKCGKKF